MEKIEVPKAKVTIRDKDYYADPAVIKKTYLGFHDDRGFMTASLLCEGPGWGVMAGNACLDGRTKDYDDRVPTVYAGAFIAEVLKVLDLDSWEQLPHTKLQVLFDSDRHIGASQVGIANIELTRAVIWEHIFTDY